MNSRQVAPAQLSLLPPIFYPTAQRNAVDALSDHALNETEGRISQAVERHVAGSGAVLETAFSSGK